MPRIAEEKGDRGDGVVEIDLLPNGALSHDVLEQSSGNSLLEHSAFRTARMTKYQRNAKLRRDLGFVLIRSGLLEP